METSFHNKFVSRSSMQRKSNYEFVANNFLWETRM
jgi:hypothetical protein